MNLRKGSKVANWILETKLGLGGNSQVWKVVAPDCSESRALKILTSDNQEKRARFEREVGALRDASSIDGVMQLYETNVQEQSNTDPLWFTMPVGTPVLDVLSKLSLAERASLLLRIAIVVEELHRLDLSHRDIKPENFILVDDDVQLSDFGLIELPTRSNLTRVGQRIGSYATIAPEMRYWTPGASGKPSDIYSLAKSLWIMLTEDLRGFEGEHSSASKNRLEQRWPGEHLAPVNALISKSTNPLPESRPNISEFIAQHRAWIEEFSELEKKSPNQWQAIAHSMFPLGVPTSASWKELSDIVRVLKEIGKQHRVHHVFLPTGGGSDLTGVEFSDHLAGCIDMNFGGTFALVSPTRLHYERFPSDSSWNYFLLECGSLPNIEDDPYMNSDRLSHEYLELTQGVYTHRRHSDIDEFRGCPLPDGSRIITRYTSGQFLIVHRTSIYNRVSSTYDARHNKMSAELFRTYIEQQISAKDEDTETIDSGNSTERFETDDFDWWSDPNKRPQLVHLTEEQLSSAISLAEKVRNNENDAPQIIDMAHISTIRSDPLEKELANLLDSLDDEAFIELVALYWLGRELFESGIKRISRRYFIGSVKSAAGTSRSYLQSKSNLHQMLTVARDLVRA